MSIHSNKGWLAQPWPALLALAMLFWVGALASGQNSLSQGPPSPSGQDSDTKQWQVANVDEFLDSHPEIAEQLRKDPSLIKNEQFVSRHPALQEYLKQHPGIREEFSENPQAFMRQEQRYDQREGERGRVNDNDTKRWQIANMDRFLDSHPEIAEQLRKNPSLITNEQFVNQHPALRDYLQQHPGIREEFSENPRAFMNQEQRFDRQEGEAGPDRDRPIDRDNRNTARDRDNPNSTVDRDDRNTARDRDNRTVGDDGDTRRWQIANMDQFLDSHREIAEQLQNNPSLINNQEFVEKHPELKEYLKQHPGIREEFTENPNSFMRQQRRFDQREQLGNRQMGDRDTTRGELTSFGQFMGSHSGIAQQLSKDPSLVNNREYLESHGELRDYLKAHPGVKEELTENPQAFMNSVQQANNTTAKASTVKPKKHK